LFLATFTIDNHIHLDPPQRQKHEIQKKRRKGNTTGSVPIRRNPFRRILKKYIVVLWKKIILRIFNYILVRTFCYCNSEPSQHS